MNKTKLLVIAILIMILWMIVGAVVQDFRLKEPLLGSTSNGVLFIDIRMPSDIDNLVRSSVSYTKHREWGCQTSLLIFGGKNV
jgi:hypothetical protein